MEHWFAKKGVIHPVGQDHSSLCVNASCSSNYIPIPLSLSFDLAFETGSKAFIIS
jgi:hypothetical protein